jgi:NAD-specific glutamate dehydrogenase
MTNAVRSADTQEARAAAARLAEARALITDKDLLAFFDALFLGALPDDVLQARAERLVALARALHDEVARHRSGAIDVTVLDDDETHESVLVGINDDRPFLFDSAVAAAIAGGARIRAAFHPIIAVKGQPTSVIALICDGLAGDSRAMLQASLRDTFAQGLVAVRDWKAMLARLKEARGGLASAPPRTPPSWTGWPMIISCSWARAPTAWARTARMAGWSRSPVRAWACSPTRKPASSAVAANAPASPPMSAPGWMPASP